MSTSTSAHSRLGAPMSWCAIFIALSASCSSPQKAPGEAGITPQYDKASGRLTELAYDSNHNGKTDTWTQMDGPRPIQTRIDRNEDGRPDRWEYYDEQSKLLKVGFSRKDDGRADAWAFADTKGQIQRIEVSSSADDKKIDRWEHYEAAGMRAVEEDTNHDGVVDKWETYAEGVVTAAAFDEDGDGRADRRLTYAGGTLVSIESEPDTAGNFMKRVAVR